jgi:hypothetical protein
MPKKPDDLTAPPVPLRVEHVAEAAREDRGVPAVRDDWGNQQSVGPVRDTMQNVERLVRELTANNTLNFEVLAALDLLVMVCTASVALSFEMPTPTPNPLARRVAAAKVALRGSMANKAVLQLAICDFLEQLVEGESATEERPLRFEELPAQRKASLAKASSAAQAIVASVRSPKPETMLDALRNLHPAVGSHAGDQSVPTEQKKWHAINVLLIEMGIGSESGPGLARSLRTYRSERGAGS